MEEKKKEQKSSGKKGKINKSRNTESQPKELKMSFDAYFRQKMSQDLSVRPHHKAPMRSFVESKGLTNGTFKDFEIVLKDY